MKGMVGSQSWKPADACREACEGEERDSRLEKVDRLRTAIAGGEYRVSAEDLAERLLWALFGRFN